jgi:(1->4)-alpha-D-glucan 1-alpha-D-glucosylmutase
VTAPVERRATYRLQLHAGFPLPAVTELVDYLDALGVSHVYLSPVLQAAAGSTHGYDIVDHSRVSDALGGDAALLTLADRLAAAGMSVLLDIVPNHMAITGRDNAWWWDVLENGPASLYAAYFDVDWDPPESKLRNRVLMPVLGDHYGRVLEAGEITLTRNGGAFTVHYYDHEFPVAPRALDTLLAIAADRAASDELASIALAFGRLPHSTHTDAPSVRERHRDKEVLRARLAELCERDVGLAKAIDTVVAEWNDDPDALDALLDRQNYRLAFWRVAGRELDYRRFFDINELVALRVERADVFAATHARIADWLASGVIDGARVDHVDGLRDPDQYLTRLRDLRPDRSGWIVVEKVLAPGEQLRATWPVAGTTGYDFARLVTGVLVDPAGEAPLTELYRDVTGEDVPFAEVARTARWQIMRTVLAADVARVAALFMRVCEANRRYRDYTRHELADAVREVAASFPVYRTYGPDDSGVVHEALSDVRSRRPDVDGELLAFFGDVLAGRQAGDDATELRLRFQQLTGPVMAKGNEDTAFYRYHRFIAGNEVGSDPACWSVSVDEFHAANAARAEQWPASLLATATHDTKRGEDVRARLAVLAEIPHEWAAAVRGWEQRAEGWNEDGVVDANIRYLIWQTLVGAWPITGDRLRAYVEKAAREAKVHTSWVDPDPRYEAGLAAFVDRVLLDGQLAAAIAGFVDAIEPYGRANSIVQLGLKLTAPGIPDIYQGTEFWDHNLVDPDNRRPVDYAARADTLATGAHPKQALLADLLARRRNRPDLLGAGASYEPLNVTGAAADHVVAFARGGGLVVAAGRLPYGVRAAGGWRDTAVITPAGDAIAVETKFGEYPFAVWEG